MDSLLSYKDKIDDLNFADDIFNCITLEETVSLCINLTEVCSQGWAISEYLFVFIVSLRDQDRFWRVLSTKPDRSGLIMIITWHFQFRPTNASMLYLNIQIEICAEYRDMLPRPMLVCQEPGLRPIGRSPGVPDKSSRGLGSMSRYSAQILICFIAYIFSTFNFSVGLVGNLAELPPCTVPPATVHCYQNEAAQCSSDNQISQHALLRGSRKKHYLAFMPQNWWN